LTLPLYDYQCRSCRKTTEVRHGFKETFEGKCPECGGEMARVFSPAGIVFKGSGFYLTDSRKAAEAKAGGEKGAASSSSDSSSSAPAAPATPAPATTPGPSKSESAA
jgi:putative FmdB family regulatory protein